MVVEVPGAGVVAKADVETEIGPGDGVEVTRAHHLDRVTEQAECGDGEDLVRVKGTVVGGDQHPARL